MVTKLELYNKALGHLGPTRLANVSENRPAVAELNAVYNGTLQAMLERGLWFFALRTVRLEPDTNVEPNFGRPYAYSIPTDFVRLRLICVDERQEVEDRSYRREGSYWFSDASILYITYVSNHTDWGLNLGAFTELYAEAIGAELAWRSGLPITKDRGTKNDLLIIKKRLLNEAKRLEAVDERVKAKPPSSWVQSRLGGSRGQRRESTG